MNSIDVAVQELAEDSITIPTADNPPAFTGQVSDVSLMSLSVEERVHRRLDQIVSMDTGLADKWDQVAALRQEIAEIRNDIDPIVRELKEMARHGLLDASLLADIGEVLLPRRLGGIKEIRDSSGLDGKEIWAELSFRKHARARRNQEVAAQPVKGEFGVYTLNDADGQIVYVGRSIDIWGRLTVHAREKQGWVTWEWFPCLNDQEMKVAEARLIDIWQPSLNKRREFPK